jgi:tetratricopeptide (TPR) repeat protein
VQAAAETSRSKPIDFACGFSALLLLLAGSAPAASQTIEGQLKSGESLERYLPLARQQTAALTVTKQHATVRVTVKVAGKTLRDIASNALSVAAVRILLLGEKGPDFQVTLSNLGPTSSLAQFQMVIDSPRETTGADQAVWDAETILFSPPPGPADPKAPMEETVSQLRRALGEFEKTGDLYQQILALRKLGGLHTQQQDFAAAHDDYERAAVMVMSSPWRFEESVIRQNLAYTLQALGRNRAAITELDRVMALRAELKDELGHGITSFGRAQTRWKTGEFQRALDDYRLSLSIFRNLGESGWEANVLNAMGLLNAELGRMETARANYGDASTIWRRLQDQNGLMMTTNNVGLLKETLGLHDDARAAFLEAIRLCEGLGNRQAHAYILQNLGDVAANQGDHAAALQFYRESLAMKRQLGDVQAAAETKRKMGLSLLALQQWGDARSVLQAALSESRDASDRKGEAQSLGALARLDAASRSPAAAEERIAQAVRLIESTRTELRTRDLRTSYFSRQQDFYDFAIDLAMEPGGSGAAHALEWSERARARTLLDSAQTDDSAANDPLASIASDQELRRDLLTADTTLVEYSSSPSPSRTYVWLLSSGGLRTIRLPGSNAIAPAVERLRDALDAVQKSHSDPGAGSRLNRALEGVAALIWWPLGLNGKTSRVLIAPDSALEAVPFAALPVSAGGGRLVEQCEVVSIPSASLVAAIRRRQGVYPRHIGIFADPVFSAADLRIDRAHRGGAGSEELSRLRFSREEARAISHLAGSQSATEWLDFGAPVENLRRSVAEPGAVLHLATHAIVDDRDPAASRLVFSRVNRAGQNTAGELRLNDIYNLRIRRQRFHCENSSERAERRQGRLRECEVTRRCRTIQR